MTEAESASAPSAGALLRAARERQGLHIAALAAAIKVTPRKLDALEHDRWNELPDATFTRALAQTVCRSLKIDPKPVLDLLPPAETFGLESVGGTMNEPLRERGSRDDGGWTGAAIKPLVLAALLLLLAAMVIYLAPSSWWSRGPAAPPPSATVIAPLPALPASAPLASAEPATAAPAAEGPAAAATGSEPAASRPDAKAGPAPGGAGVSSAAGAAVQSADTALTGAAPGAAEPGGALQLRASGASWIEVRDADGRLLLSRIVQAGEAVGLDGAAPLRLVIGNAPGTAVTFRGHPVDLAPHTRDSVARLELK